MPHRSPEFQYLLDHEAGSVHARQRIAKVGVGRGGVVRQDVAQRRKLFLTEAGDINDGLRSHAPYARTEPHFPAAGTRFCRAGATPRQIFELT